MIFVNIKPAAVDKLPDNLKYLREKFGLKQAEMQAQLNIKRTTWLGYEKGTSQPVVKELVRIALFFGVNEADLLHKDLSKAGNLIASLPSFKIEKSGNLTGKGKGNLTGKKVVGKQLEIEADTLAMEDHQAYLQHDVPALYDFSENWPSAYNSALIQRKMRALSVKILDIENRITVLEGKKK